MEPNEPDDTPDPTDDDSDTSLSPMAARLIDGYPAMTDEQIARIAALFD
jgi:hypothetical protein